MALVSRPCALLVHFVHNAEEELQAAFAALGIGRHSRIHPEDLALLKKAADEDGDGRLCGSEFEALVTASALRETFNRYILKRANTQIKFTHQFTPP